ncbi:MAG: hypothetical protein SLAVMIC_00803 [uncultured marine phage]|uniref:DUF1653 domain-containing protein n=1 Tax=uncultured marine phage TaxID=707152 RepID=A0A8D9C9J6_9VIRU|nr:MAG: hypothetical protein SLAVMIC_00803 [uncultured marine phage]
MKYPEINGTYKHYKGGKYTVISMTKHSETDEVLVIYKSIHWGSYHVRPLDMWFDEVNMEVGNTGIINETVPRFKLID